MAGDWIKMRNDLADDPAVIAIAEASHLDEFAVVGRLHALWAWADEQSRDGHARGVTCAWLNRKVQCDGFAEALVDVGWLESGKGGLSIPNFENHNGKTAKVRALSTRRKQVQRTAEIDSNSVSQSVTHQSRNGRDKSVTREEKRREEKKTLPASAGEGRFSDFWNTWPSTDRKVDRKKCLAKWKLAHFDDQADEILAHVAAMKPSRKWTEGFEPAPLRYLNGEQWRDGVAVSRQGNIYAGAI